MVFGTRLLNVPAFSSAEYVHMAKATASIIIASVIIKTIGEKWDIPPTSPSYNLLSQDLSWARCNDNQWSIINLS